MVEGGKFYADEGLIGGHSPPYEVFRMGGAEYFVMKSRAWNGMDGTVSQNESRLTGNTLS